jgi:hypothetical protein
MIIPDIFGIILTSIFVDKYRERISNMSVERRTAKIRKEARGLLARTEYRAVRIGGYVASCVSHDPVGRGKVEAWATEDQYLLPRVCKSEEEYLDALAHATRVAQKVHAKTKCTHELVVTLNVS